MINSNKRKLCLSGWLKNNYQYDRLHPMIKKEPIPSGMSPLKESDFFL